MRLSAGRHTLQKGGKLGYHDGTSLDGESVKRTRAHLSEDGGIPSAGKSGEESDELEEGELTSNSSGSQHKYGDGSCHRFPRGPSSNPYDYSDGGSSDPGVDSRDSHRRTAESLLRSLPIETRIEYTDQKKLTGVAPISKYKISRKIGEGSFGEVIIATDEKTSKRVALKKVIIHKDTDGVPITALREIMILKSLDHENVIRLKEVALSQGSDKDFTPGVIYIVFPYMEHDLAGLLDNPEVNLTPAQIKCYTRQLLEGMAYLHRKGILHRDMKSANVLVGDSGILKIADFGLARHYDKSVDSSELTPTVITAWYRPPELLLGSKVYTSAVDMWGIGCIFAELWDRKAIFAGQKDMDVLKKILQICGVPSRDEWSEFYSLAKEMGMCPKPAPKRIYERFKNTLDPTTIKFIRYMFTYDPMRRPTAAQALKHEYFYIDPPPARRNTPDFPPWPESHELGTRLVRDKDGNPIENAHTSKSAKNARVHRDILLDSDGKIIPRARIKMHAQSPRCDSTLHRRLPLTGHHNNGRRLRSREVLYSDEDSPRRDSVHQRKRKREFPHHLGQHGDRHRRPHSRDETTTCRSSCRSPNYHREVEYRRGPSADDSYRRKFAGLTSSDSSATDKSLENGECRER